MAKKILKVNDDIELTYKVDGYILGVLGYASVFNKTYSLKEIKKINDNKKNKKVFACLNRLIFNDELDKYKKTLLKLDQMGLDGIIIGDVSALNYDLKTDLILDQMHLNNCYQTINFYVNNGVKGVLLTNDITKDEIDEIRKNTNAILFKQVFGYPHLSTSKRRLVSNYFKHFNLVKANGNSYKIKEANENNYYKIIEDDFGTFILEDNALNLLGVNLNVDYEIIDSYMIKDVKEVVLAFMKNDLNKKNIIDKKYNANDGFINKKTIYKVKKDEKKES